MKKVLVFGMTDNPGGMESCIMNYYRHIDKSKVSFDFLTNFENMVYSDEVRKNGSKIFLIPKKGENPIAYKIALNKFFSAYASQYDVLWYNTCTLANIDYLIYAKKFGIQKRIIHAHNSGNESSKIKGIFHFINRHRVMNYATNFWSCSLAASKFFYSETIMSGQKHEIVYNAIDLEKFSFDPEIRKIYRKKLNIDNKFVIGHIGRFQTQKNHIFLIEIFKELLTYKDNAILLLVGQGELESEIKTRVKEYGLEKKVLFLGQRNDISNILDAIDIFVFPSLFEGLGIVLVEAQAKGVTCFTSKNVVPKEVNITGLVNFIDINLSAKDWAIKIFQTNITHNNICLQQSLKNSNYNIKIEAEKLSIMFKN